MGFNLRALAYKFNAHAHEENGALVGRSFLPEPVSAQ